MIFTVLHTLSNIIFGRDPVQFKGLINTYSVAFK